MALDPVSFIPPPKNPSLFTIILLRICMSFPSLASIGVSVNPEKKQFLI